MSWQRHPDTEALARYQAGLVGGFRGKRIAAHVADCAQCASVGDQLTAVSSVLASVPASSLPDTVERQITAALAAEATTRQAAAATRQAADPAPKATPAPKPTGPRGGRSTRRFRPVMAAVSAVVCLLLAGFGYLLSQTGSSSTESTATSGSSASRHVGAAAAAPAMAPASTAISPMLGRVPYNAAGATFTVVKSGTNYQQATLATQVRSELAARGASPVAAPSGTQPTAGQSGNPSSPSGTSKSSGSAAAGSTAGIAPSSSLVGCVLHLTENVPPSFVDQATYEGKPAYVIATADKAWVVGPDCTASDPALITSTTLTSG